MDKIQLEYLILYYNLLFLNPEVHALLLRTLLPIAILMYIIINKLS